MTFNTAKTAQELKKGDIAYTNYGFMKVLEKTAANITAQMLYGTFDENDGEIYSAMSGQRYRISATKMAEKGLEIATFFGDRKLEAKYGKGVRRYTIKSITLKEEGNFETEKGFHIRLQTS